MHRNRSPCNSFLMVKMASSMDDDDVKQHDGHPADTKSCSLELQHMFLIHIKFKLTAVISTDPLTSITWPNRGLRIRAHQGRVFFEVYRWPSADFRLDRGHMPGYLVENRAGLFGSWLMPNPGFKVIPFHFNLVISAVGISVPSIFCIVENSLIWTCGTESFTQVKY